MPKFVKNSFFLYGGHINENLKTYVVEVKDEDFSESLSSTMNYSTPELEGELAFLKEKISGNLEHLSLKEVTHLIQSYNIIFCALNGVNPKKYRQVRCFDCLISHSLCGHPEYESTNKRKRDDETEVEEELEENPAPAPAPAAKKKKNAPEVPSTSTAEKRTTKKRKTASEFQSQKEMKSPSQKAAEAQEKEKK